VELNESLPLEAEPPPPLPWFPTGYFPFQLSSSKPFGP